MTTLEPTKEWHYWMDDDLKIRTCPECKISEFQNPHDGIWILYATRERILWYCDYIEKHGLSPGTCEYCKDLR